jgi:hypothetical protein
MNNVTSGLQYQLSFLLFLYIATPRLQELTFSIKPLTSIFRPFLHISSYTELSPRQHGYVSTS